MARVTRRRSNGRFRIAPMRQRRRRRRLRLLRSLFSGCSATRRRAGPYRHREQRRRLGLGLDAGAVQSIEPVLCGSDMGVLGASVGVLGLVPPAAGYSEHPMGCAPDKRVRARRRREELAEGQLVGRPVTQPAQRQWEYSEYREGVNDRYMYLYICTCM
jgi:hypothetical protein